MPRKSACGINGASVTMRRGGPGRRPFLCRVLVPHTKSYVAKCFDSHADAVAWAHETIRLHESPLRLAQSAYINAIQAHYGKTIPAWVRQRIVDRSGVMFQSIDRAILRWQKDAPLRSGMATGRMAWGHKRRMKMADELR